MAKGKSKLSGGTGAGGSSTQELKGNVSFEQIMKATNNAIHFSKIVTLLPDRYAPVSGKKSELGELLERYNITEVRAKMYRDRSGANDLKRLKELGFEIQAQHLGKQAEGSKIPPEDYYFLKKKKK